MGSTGATSSPPRRSSVIVRALRPLRLSVTYLVLALGAAAPAQARWRSPVDLGPAARAPVIGFDPSGGAALAWGLTSIADQQDVAVVRAPFGGDFGAAQTVATGDPDPSRDLQIVLPGTGAAVLRTFARVFVAPAGATAFGPAQDLGGAQQPDLQEPDARLIATPTGEVVASVMHSEGDEATAVLPAGSSTFGGFQQYPSLNPNAGQPVPVASDPQGDAFLADFGTCSSENDQSVALLARPPGGRFRLSTALRCRSISSANPFPVLGTGQHGGLALVTVTGTPGHYALVVQTRYRGRVSRPHVLARSTQEPNPLGPPVVNLGGGVTIGWTTCPPASDRCTVSAAEGSLRPGTWHTRTFGRGLGLQVGNGYAALSHCTKGICQISVSLVDRRGRFGGPRTLTRDGQIVYGNQLTDDPSGGRRRERAIVWTSSHGGLFASVSDPGRPGFGPVRRLAPDGSVSYTQVNDQTGPRDQVLVTWLSPDRTAHAVVYAP